MQVARAPAASSPLTAGCTPTVAIASAPFAVSSRRVRRSGQRTRSARRAQGTRRPSRPARRVASAPMDLHHVREGAARRCCWSTGSACRMDGWRRVHAAPGGRASRCFAVDLPGFGALRRRWPGPPTMAALAGACARLHGRARARALPRRRQLARRRRSRCGWRCDGTRRSAPAGSPPSASSTGWDAGGCDLAPDVRHARAARRRCPCRRTARAAPAAAAAAPAATRPHGDRIPAERASRRRFAGLGRLARASPRRAGTRSTGSCPRRRRQLPVPGHRRLGRQGPAAALRPAGARAPASGCPQPAT